MNMALKAALGMAGAAAALYLLLCGAMYLRQRDLMYFPQVTRVDAGATDFQLERPGVVLRGWRVNPQQRDALLYFGGNAESIEAMREPLARWAPGRTAYLVSYRGYGASDGEPSEAALAADAVHLYDHVQARHPGGTVAVIGRSLGSGVAAHVASQRPVAALVLVTPFDSLAAVAAGHYPWLPVNRLLHDRYDSAQHLRAYRGPVLVVQAEHDAVVPAARTARLVAGLPQRPQVRLLAGVGHNFDADQPGYGAAVAQFLAHPPTTGPR